MHAARPIRSAGGRIVVMGAGPHKAVWPIRDFHIPNGTLNGFIVTDPVGELGEYAVEIRKRPVRGALRFKIAAGSLCRNPLKRIVWSKVATCSAKLSCNHDGKVPSRPSNNIAERCRLEVKLQSDH